MSKDFRNFIAQLKLEAIALATLMIVLTYESPYSLWWLLITFLAFDVGAIGYLYNTKIGAYTYNFMHNYTVPTLLIVFGIVFSHDLTALIGYCWTFHISIDRALGFGLKHKHSFHETHMGKIGKK